MGAHMTATSKSTAATLIHADAQPSVKSTAMAACACPPTRRIDATETIGDRDSYAVTSFAEIIDRALHATAARFTMGLSPAALSEAYLDWATHLAFSPGKWMQLIDKATSKAVRITCL